MTTPQSPKAEVTPSGKKISPFFGAVRDRGLLNSMLDGPSKAYEAKFPDRRCHWEYWPANGDNTMVVARESMGYALVDASDIADTTSSTSHGIVRRGDLVLMSCTVELADAVKKQDDDAAKADRDLPVTTYAESLKANKVRLSSGDTDYARPVVQPVKTTVEQVGIPESLITGG